MAFIKEAMLFYMIITLIVGLSVTGASADGAQVSLTTKTFSGIGTDLVTVTLPVQSPTVNLTASTCGASLPKDMGFIGVDCDEATQPGTLPFPTPPFAAQGTSSVDTFTGPIQTVTSITTAVSSFVSTLTEPPRTITMTLSEVFPSMTVTAMCDWPEENIITPCTTVVLATGLGTAAIPTSSKSAAASSMSNPVKAITSFSKHAASKALNFFTGLTNFLSAGAVDDINEGAFQALNRLQPRQTYQDCRQIPALYTPMIMTVISILNGVFLFYAFDINNPRRTALATATYVLTFIIVYVCVIYVEYYNISVGPVWNQCFSAMSLCIGNENLVGKA